MTARMPGVTVRLSACRKTFRDGTLALHPLDLQVGAGETLVLLGPSGCGKTTTLRLIAGLEHPDAGGTVWFDNEDVTQQPIERRQVGMVFQSYALFPNLTVQGNVAYGLRVRGMPAAQREARVREMLQMMRIEALSNRTIDALSGGQRQRVALARALAPQPRVLLLDEPLTALDAKLREEVRLDIDRLLRSLGVTTVYVTHDQSEAMALGDRIAVMAQGRIAQIGTPEQIYREPADAFVAGFIGTLNRIQGQIVGNTLVFAGGRLPLPEPASHRLEQGSSGLLMFRAEDLRLVSDGQAQFGGRVTNRFFLGDHIRLVIDVGCDEPVIARIGSHESAAVGQAVSCAVEPSALRWLPGTAHTSPLPSTALSSPDHVALPDQRPAHQA